MSSSALAQSQPGQYLPASPQDVQAPYQNFPSGQEQAPAIGSQVPNQQVPAQQVPNQVIPPPQNVSAPPQMPPGQLPPLPSDFDVGAEQALGLDPSEITTLRRMLDDRQRAASEFPNPPSSVTGSISLSLDPGSSPAVIRPFHGLSTSLVILDSTGAPWPVENFNNGNKNLFEIERLDGPSGSSFIISPLQAYGQGNIILKLMGHPTPVVINLISGQKEHDARVEARVLGRGPNARVTSMSLTPSVDSRMLSVLDGVPPEGRSLRVQGDSSARAWMMPNGRMWLRTSMLLVSPAPISFVSSSDGTRVYEISPSSRIMAMVNERYVTLSIEGCLQECNSGENQTGYDW